MKYVNLGHNLKFLIIIMTLQSYNWYGSLIAIQTRNSNLRKTLRYLLRIFSNIVSVIVLFNSGEMQPTILAVIELRFFIITMMKSRIKLNWKILTAMRNIYLRG